MRDRQSVTTNLLLHSWPNHVAQGTRVHIYRWLDSAKARKEADSKHLQSLPVIETKKKWTLKKHPGKLIIPTSLHQA